MTDVPMPKPMPPPSPDEPWVVHGMAALWAAVADDMTLATDIAGDLYATGGWQAMQQAMQLWADIAMREAGIAPGTVLKPVWRELDSGVVTDASRTPAPARWAGQMLSARAANDPQMWTALLHAIPGDNAGPSIEQFLVITATQIRQARQDKHARRGDVGPDD